MPEGSPQVPHVPVPLQGLVLGIDIFHVGPVIQVSEPLGDIMLIPLQQPVPQHRPDSQVDRPVLRHLDPDKAEEPRHQGRDSLSKLTPRGLTVLCLRYGLNGNKEHTLEEIGYYFSLTRERIRQLEAKAIRTIRYYYNRYKGADRKAFMQEYEAKMIEVQKFIDENNYKYEAKMNMYSQKGKREYIKPVNDVDERQQSILLDFFTAGLSSL